jgi:hypothetical protein
MSFSSFPAFHPVNYQPRYRISDQPADCLHHRLKVCRGEHPIIAIDILHPGARYYGAKNYAPALSESRAGYGVSQEVGRAWWTN